MNGIEHLKWDSDFFGKKIGRLKCEKLSMNPKDIDMGDYDLVYIFSKEELNPYWDDCFMDKKMNIHIDHKSETPVLDPNIIEIFKPQREAELEKLVLLNGQRSRFYLDPKLKHKYEELYLKWGEKCFNFETNRTWYYIIENQLAGFFTMDVSQKYFAELCTIHPNHLRKGIAEKLLRNGFNEVSKNSISNIRISYQGGNLPAQKMYDKLGFKPYEVWYVYHLWK